MAFVSLQEDGERDFSFYRNPSSDLLLSEAEIEPTIFQTDDILHFGSVDLVESPMKQAHLKAIHSVERQGGLISFDPNVRLPLWTSPDECRKTIQAFIPTAHILKISEDELDFITGIPSSEKAIAALFKGNVKAVVYTRGKNGADLYLSPEEKYQSQGFNVEVQDTTGAGDAFVGGLLYQLLDKKATQENLTELLRRNHHEIMLFANATGAITTMKKGAIPALPNQMDVQRFIQQESNEGMITDV
ncbi:5-dehydro-2-deoxygluconokinase [compost metagenome]